MRRMRKVWAVLLAVCVLCSAYGGNVQAVGQSTYTTANNLTETTTDTAEKSNSGNHESGEADVSEENPAEDAQGNSGNEAENSESGNESGKEDQNNAGTSEETGENNDSPEGADENDGEDVEGGTENDGAADETGGKDDGLGDETGSGEDNGPGDETSSGGDGLGDEISSGDDGPGDETGSGEDNGLEEEPIDENNSLEEIEAIKETDSPSKEIAPIYAGGSGEVSRIEWLAALVDTFDISVAEDNYPDNYYSDVDASSDQYRVIMLATEFGLVDVEAGEEFRPDDPAVREFAAHTLNFCLGFLPAEENTYTYSESTEVTYADDIQVAVERGWFQLADGSFLPDAAITAAEKNAMLTDAKSVLDERKAVVNYDNSYTFAEDVIDLTRADVRVELTDVNVLTFYEGFESITAGKKYGLEFDGFPMVFRVTGIAQSEDGMAVQFETVPLEEAFTAIDMQGSMGIDLATVQAYSDDVELHYIVGGTEAEKWEDGTKYDTLEEVGDREISAVEAVKTYAVPEGKSHEIDLAPGVKITVSCKVSDVRPHYEIKLLEDRAHVSVDAKVIFSCNVSADVLEAAGVSPTLELVRIPIACVGYFGVKTDLTMSGSATLNLVENVSLGLYYEHGDFRMDHSFTKDSFTLQTHMEISATVTATLGMNACNIMQGELYGKFGAKNVLDSITYDDGQKPTTCAHHSAWLFASVGGFAQVNLLLDSKSWGKDFPIYTEKNSPVRVSFHYEDGVAVSSCTRGTTHGSNGRKWGYYTPADSKYGYNGASKGTGANGEPYTIFEYSLDDANRATITGYKGNVSALSIPETLDGYTVVKIGSSVFRDNKLLRMVVVPDSVTEIGNGAFRNCANLSQVTLSKNLEKIYSTAFYNCDALTAIEIPKSLKSVSTASGSTRGVFADCDGLKNVTFENGTTQIVNSLFANCLGIEEITIPDTVTTIGSGAFEACESLKRADISNAVTVIDNNAFANCSNLSEIVVPDSVTEIGSGAFRNCANLSQVTLSKNLEKIYSTAFYNCDALTAIEIPKSLKSVSTVSGSTRGVFADCDGLKNVTFENGTTQIVNSLFANCLGIEEITIPDTVTMIGSCAFEACNSLKRAGISNAVTVIDNNAFANCSNLSEIVVPDSVTEIGSGAFRNCANLSQVTLSKNLGKIYSTAFYNCDALTAIEIPKSLKSVSTASGSTRGVFADCDGLKNVTFENGTTQIVNSLFANCLGIEEITIPDTVTTIGSYAFEACDSLKKVSMSDSVTVIEGYAFRNCAKLMEISISNNVTELGNNVFQDCTNLPEITLPDSITDMGTYIFSGCSSLQEVTFPNTGKSVAEGTFKNCSGLEKVNFPETLEAICSYAFYNTKLTEADLPKNLSAIENYAFYNCDALTRVTIPDSVTTLGTYIFAECELLSDVTLGTGITTIPSYAFNLCPSLQKIVLPYRTATIKSNAFTNCTSLTEITIPRATTTIADGVFSYPARLTIYGVPGTYAETYANDIGATFVSRETKATEAKLSAAELKLTKGSKTTLHLSVTPSDFTDKVTWKSTDVNIVTVEDTGVVTAKAIGTATVKVTVGDISSTCKITVTQPVTSISLNKTTLSLEAWDTEKLTASVSPSTAENKEIMWSTSDNRIASVDGVGLVTAHRKGTATITAAAQDGSGVSRQCTVTVVNDGYICSSPAELESPHNYPVDCSDFWQYTKEGAESLYITFDSRTEVEDGFDYLYIYDGKGKQVGKYTGTQLSGQVVEVIGDTVRIKLVSDDSGTAWGFRVTYIMGTGDVENDEYLVTFDSQGGSVVSAVLAAKGTAVTEPAAPTREGYEFLGWYLGNTLYDFTQPVTGNIVLQAKWKFILPESDPTETGQIPEEDKPDDGIIPDGLWIAGVKDQAYTGKALKPEVRVYDGSRRLQEKTDYTISYKNNTKANDASNTKKAPTITVKGKGNYSGSATATFKIAPVNIAGNSGAELTDQDTAVIIADKVLAYNGKVQKKAPTVTFYGKKLAVKRDYIVAYPDTGSGAYQEAGRYPVQITGVGNFTGTKTVYLEITDKTLISKAKSVKIPKQMYNGGEEVTLPSDVLILYMKKKDDPLTQGVDYTVSYENNREIGTATAIVTGMGSYAGTKRITFKIAGTDIKKAVVEGVENKVYNGKEQQQNITVKVGGNILTVDKDYTVIYNKNQNVGKANMTIQGIGAYSGTVKKTFKITAYDLGIDESGLITKWKDDQRIDIISDLADEPTVKSGEKAGTSLTVEYTQGGCRPEVLLKFGETELIKGKDYTISYKYNKNIAGLSAKKVPTITIKGKGNFKGTFSEKFSIVKKNLANPESPVKMSVADVAYAKSAGKYISKPVLTDTNGKTLKAGTDYDVSYMASDGITKLNKKSTVKAGSYVCVTVKGKGKYEGSLMTTYRITQANFTKASVKIAPQTYTGSRIYLTGGDGGDVTVQVGKTDLIYGVDYEIMEDSYANNIKKGTASVKIRGINNYGGTKTVKFKIRAKKMETFSSIVRRMKECDLFTSKNKLFRQDIMGLYALHNSDAYICFDQYIS